MEPTGTFREEGPGQTIGDGDPSPETFATAARLVLGATSLGVDALSGWLRSGGSTRASDATVAAADAGSMSDAVLGAAVRGAQTALAIGARGADLAARGLQTAVGGTSRAVDWAMPTFLREPFDRAKERAADRIHELGMTGQEELDRARSIARAAIEDGLDAIIARFADSREVQLVIRTQSVTAAEEVVEGLRDRTAGIDDRLEIATRRLFRRSPRGSTGAGD